MLYALLGHAVSTAASVEDARRIVEGFADEFGLLATAQVLAYKVALASIDPAKLIEASQSVRAEVFESCRHDLVSGLRAEEPDALTNLHFGRYEALIGELSVFAKKLIADGEAKAYELAGRFVTLRPAERDGMPAERTHISTLSKCLCHKICGAWMRFRSMTITTWSPVTAPWRIESDLQQSS